MTLDTSIQKPHWRFIKRYEEILKQINTTHTYYDYSKSVYAGIDNNIIIICPIHGEFEQTPYRHFTMNKKCPKCSNENTGKLLKKPIEEFIEKANNVHNNKYSYDLVEYKTLTNKVIIICPAHGQFKQRAADHLQGHSCSDCGYKNASNSIALTQQEFIERANRVHNNKYDYSKLKYKRAKFKVIITCPIHGDFVQMPSDHLNGNGCQLCGDLRKRAKYFNEPTLLYYIYFPAFNAYKIGITLASRGVVKRYATEKGIEYKIISTTLFNTGKEAYLEEQRILKENSSYRYSGPKFFNKGGESECFNIDVLGLNKDEDIVESAV